MKATTKKLIIKICDKIIKMCEPKTTQVVEVQTPAKKEEKQPFYQFKVGEILVSSWGYDQTNVEFFQITKATKSTVWFRKIASKQESVESSMSGYVIPCKDQFLANEEEQMRRISTHFAGVKLYSFANAHLWDNKPEFYSCWA